MKKIYCVIFNKGGYTKDQILSHIRNYSINGIVIDKKIRLKPFLTYKNMEGEVVTTFEKELNIKSRL